MAGKRTEYHRQYSRRPGARLSRIRRLAKARGIPYGLDDKIDVVLLYLPCTYCGAKPQPTHTLDIAGSRDRGYVGGNVTPCCDECHEAKGTRTRAEFLTWVARIYKRISAS